MKKFNRNYERLVGEIINYVHKLVDKVVEQKKKIIIWGYGQGGRWLRHLIEDYDGRIRIEYIIDENLRLSYDSFPVIYRQTVLNYLNEEECFILSTIKQFQEVVSVASRYGYEVGKNVFDVRADIGDSYVEYLERKNSRVDFSDVHRKDCEEYKMNRDRNEHAPLKQASADSVFEEIASFDENLAFFDFGCGKGAGILLAYMYGITRLGGVELVPSIYEQAKINLRELQIDCELINGDATKCNIDNYNCFFFYNPFNGEIFGQVIQNIEKSYREHPRTIYLIYGNPFEHVQVIRNGYFQLIKQMRVDLYDPLLNIYKIESESNE